MATKNTKDKRYVSDAMAAIHETAEGLHQAGIIDKRTMRKFDLACLEPVHSFSADEIRELRMRESLSQPIFAHYMNVSKNLVSDWERGIKKPSGPALRLLTIIKEKGVQAVA